MLFRNSSCGIIGSESCYNDTQGGRHMDKILENGMAHIHIDSFLIGGFGPHPLIYEMGFDCKAFPCGIRLLAGRWTGNDLPPLRASWPVTWRYWNTFTSRSDALQAGR